MEFTKGPWKYSTNVGPTKALIVEADGSTVVEVGNRTNDSRFSANVRLMTAAPILYAALEAALEHLEEIGDVAGCGGTCEIQEQANAAIESAGFASQSQAEDFMLLKRGQLNPEKVDRKSVV